jgi:hypothetical protein
MCTVTFFPRKRGYLLAMNRDEKKTRVRGLPPAERKINSCRALFPSEPGRGTWIALNEHRTCLALVNWYSLNNRVKSNSVSRGKIIPSVLDARVPETVDARLRLLPLKRINPFRLIGIFPVLHEIVEWRWDLRHLVRKRHRWRPRQWISSGFDEPTAQKVRGQTFRRFLSQKSVGTIEWLRRLHRSHSPKTGPFSTCMHRQDAATVSFTDVSSLGKVAKIGHTCVAPCSNPRLYQSIFQ